MSSEPGEMVLTVCQPWAWAIAAGYKRVENRSRRTAYRGRLWIHAGQSRQWMPAAGELRQAGYDVPQLECPAPMVRRGGPARELAARDVRQSLVFGAIIAVAELTGCVRFDPQLHGDDPFASGPWLWQLTDVRRVTAPLACAGLPGLWPVPDSWGSGQAPEGDSPLPRLISD